MSESYFQSQHRVELEKMFEMLERFRERTKNTKHDVKYPGRVDAFLNRAEQELNNAEQIIPVMAEQSSQKAWWIAFRKTVQLAENFMVMAEADAGVVRDRDLQESRKKPRRAEIDDWLDIQLARQSDAKSPDLWCRFEARYDSINAPPPIGIDAFKKRVTKARKRLGMSKVRR